MYKRNKARFYLAKVHALLNPAFLLDCHSPRRLQNGIVVDPLQTIDRSSSLICAFDRQS